VAETRIYLDHAATTPLLPAAREAMAEALARWANPSSPHAEGRAAKAVLEDARSRIAAVLDWNGKVVFTSGASEALAIAFRRTVTPAKAGVSGPDDAVGHAAPTAFVSAVEHEAVLRAVPGAARLPVHRNGIVDTAPVSGDRPLVAIQHANNETGVLQPLDEIATRINESNGILVADCAQTAGKLPLPPADMIAISAHKFGGPPGVGALLVRDLDLLQPVGGQEQGYRPGTENLPGILATAAALGVGREWLDRAARLRAWLEQRIAAAGGEVIGAASPRIATIGAYRMPGVPSAAQLIQFDMAGVAVSAGSACSSGSLKPSHVLAAMGMDEQAAREVVRVSFAASTTEAEVDRFADLWTGMAGKRRAA
jgi:cysteine desulfurase